MTKIHYFYYLL